MQQFSVIFHYRNSSCTGVAVGIAVGRVSHDGMRLGQKLVEFSLSAMHMEALGSLVIRAFNHVSSITQPPGGVGGEGVLPDGSVVL